MTILGFLLGVQLTTTLFGALYRIIDLGYALQQYWIEIVSRIAFNSTLIFLVYYFASGSFLEGFIWGQLFFTAFHIGIFWFGQLLVKLFMSR